MMRGKIFKGSFAVSYFLTLLFAGFCLDDQMLYTTGNPTIEDVTTNRPSTTLIVNPAQFTNTPLLMCHITFSIIGIPLNLLIMLAVIRSERLQSHPNILWLGVGFANISQLTVLLLEGLTNLFPNLSIFPTVVVWLNDIPNVTTILNLFLLMLDRCICLKYSSWYKRVVTKKLIVGVQIACFVLLCLIVKSRYLFTGLPVKHVVNIPSFQTLCSISLSFIMVGVISHFVMSIKVNKSVNPPEVCCSGMKREPEGPINNQPIMAQMTNDGVAVICEGGQTVEKDDGTIWIGNRRVNRLDLEAYTNSKSSFKEFLFFLIPELSVFCMAAACLEFVSSSSDDQLSLTDKCSPFLWIGFYFRAFLLNFHSAVYNPFALLYRSSDLRSALIRDDLRAD